MPKRRLPESRLEPNFPLTVLPLRVCIAGSVKSGVGVRIIAGRWRGRRLRVPRLPELRPTPDRVRETLFNWLAPRIEGASCLDLFAGTGALSFEAASRGASRVLMVEQSAAAVAALREHAASLGADNVQAVRADVLRWLQGTAQAFDIVFLDPPFRASLVAPVCQLLVAKAWLVPGSRIYVESENEEAELGLPANWTVLRSRKAGQVHYYLAESVA